MPPPNADRLAIAQALREIAMLLSVAGENRFKVRAYERAAEELEQLAADLPALVRERRLTDVPGVGAALASVIEELFRTGSSKQLDSLRATVPRGLVELSRVPGLTRHRVELLRGAGIVDVDALREALEDGPLRAVKGFGAKTAARIRAGLDHHLRGDERMRLVDALEVMDRVLAHVRGHPATVAAEPSGAARRWHEVVRELAVVVASHDPAASVAHFLALPEIVRIESEEPHGASARLASGPRVIADVVPPDRFGTALVIRSGADAHVAALAARASERGRALPALRATTESDVYEALGLSPIPPELREGGHEIAHADHGTLPTLVTAADVRGMVHCHTTHSDGKATIAEMAAAADAMGVEYLTITDHSPTAHYAGGVPVDRLRAQWDEIAAVQERVRVRLLRGTESDILADGALDYPDRILEQLDVVIASIHSRHHMDEAEMTRRLVRAMRHPVFKIWGHALGRLVLRRPPIACRMEEVLDAIAGSRAAIELNGDPYRLDLPPEWIPPARARGIRFVVSVDAHSTAALGYLPFAVHMARRGGLTAGDVLNTRPAAEFAAAVRPAG